MACLRETRELVPAQYCELPETCWAGKGCGLKLQAGSAWVQLYTSMQAGAVHQHPLVVRWSGQASRNSPTVEGCLHGPLVCLSLQMSC